MNLSSNSNIGVVTGGRSWVYEVRDELDVCVNKVQQWLEQSKPD